MSSTSGTGLSLGRPRLYGTTPESIAALVEANERLADACDEAATAAAEFVETMAAPVDDDVEAWVCGRCDRGQCGRCSDPDCTCCNGNPDG